MTAERVVSNLPGSQHSRSDETSELLERAHDTADTAERERLLVEVVLLNMGVADGIVSRYRGRGVEEEDLRQVAYLALTQAAQRFFPGQGEHFLSYAVPSMRGAVLKHFRDRGWMIRPTRRIQELQPRVARADEELRHVLGRSPRLVEVAAHLDTPVEAVIESLATAGCFRPTSLDKPVRRESGSEPLGNLLDVDDDTEQGPVEARVMLVPAIGRLSERDKRILRLRFVEGSTQREIAADVGVTQMQVSRLLARIYRDLRDAVGDLDDPEQPAADG